MSSTSTSTNTSPSTSPLLQGQRELDPFDVDSSLSRLSVNSASTSTTKSTETRKAKQLLMPDTNLHQDPSYHESQRRARRRIKNFVFDDCHLDWKAAPALCEDHPFSHKVPSMHQDLRCNASRSYLYQVRDDLRRLQTSMTVSTDENGTLIIDGEEIIDMIG